MLEKHDIDTAWGLYEFYSDKKRRGTFNLTDKDGKAARIAFILMRVNPDLKKQEFEFYAQALPDVPGASDPQNKGKQYEKEKIKEFKPWFGTTSNQHYLERNQNNEPVEDTAPEIAKEDQWTPINTNSQNFTWLNKVANLFELPGAVKEENVPFLQKVKEIRDAQPQEQEESGSGMNWLDYAQMGLDVTGVLEPTPFSDGLNAGISVLRAIAEPKNAGGHLVNAGISLASMIPYVGDFAKIYKGYGKSGTALETLGRMKNNRSRIGKISSILYESFGGKAMEHAAGGGDGMGGGNLGGLGNIAGATNSNIFSGPGAPGSNAGGLGGGLGGLGGILGGLGGMGGGGGGGGAAGGAAGAGGSGGLFNIPAGISSFAGSVAKITAVVGTAIVALKFFCNYLDRATEQGREVLEGQRASAMWAGQSSYAMLNYDLGRIRREGERGRYLAPSTAFLANMQGFAEQSRQDYNAPYERTNTNLQAFSSALAGVTYKVLQYADLFGQAQRGLYAIIDWAAGKDNKPANPIDWYSQNQPLVPSKPKKFQLDANNKNERGFL